MIVQNEANVQEESAKNPDNCTISYKYRTKRTSAQIKKWCLYDYSILDSRVKIYLTSLCNW